MNRAPQSAPRRRPLLAACGLALTLCLTACAVGPDYRRPDMDIPMSFKEGVQWQRAQTAPAEALSETWWTRFGDDQLSGYIAQALRQNQSIVAAEAAYRVSQATVASARASLFPVVSAGASATRSGTGSAASASGNGGGVANNVALAVAVSWEPDLWGQVRRQIESSQAGAQATAAQLAGARLSVAASLASDYFALRQFDIDIALLRQQQAISAQLLAMTQAQFQQGTASNDSILVAQDTLSTVIANLQTAQTSREQFEHAIAVLVGVPPSEFSIAPRGDYAYALPAVPLSQPSELLLRRPDIAAAERTAAAANAKIGVAEAAFFPSLTLNAQGGFQHNSFSQLFSLPSLVWTLGPALAATLFDAGAREAAVQGARATYEEDAALYRNTVLSAFQSVEDSLSASNHLQESAQAYGDIYHRNQQLYASAQSQQGAGTLSEQSLLTQRLTLLLAEQNLRDTQSQLTQSSITLIKNLGGGWQDTAQAGAAPR